ncbi:autotransporter adhesin BpaC-like [Ochlerotatus camptorhynchus]|uniref:autotransporter adhesin BpaC-like n=1 Tax=Ochlerotatus camptorhynchus TaxID=644619 RepID=UPI0031D34535
MSRIVLLSIALPFLCCLLPAVQADEAEFVQGILRAADTPVYIAKPCDGTILTTCQSCDTIQICLGGSFNNLNLNRVCPSSTPYCVQGASQTGAACQSSPDSQCGVSSTNGFTCTGVGFFPDPTSCQSYHYCEQEGQVGDTYDCPVGYQYNSRSQQCTRFGLRRCQTITCDPTSQKVFIPYPMDDSYYVYCQYDYSTAVPTFQKAFMLSCGKGSTFNAQKEVCTFQCRRVGFFVNTANPNQYFSCYRQGFRWMVSVNTCSNPNYMFDEKLMRCINNPNAVTTTMSPTTVLPDTTTVAGETTTVAGETTTVAGETTTVAGETTTVAGETTTVAGETTTVAGATTTLTPDTTTVAGATTTLAPDTTTVAGATTTLAPDTTTVAGATTTVAGATTTVAGATTTVAGETTTVACATTTIAGTTTTVAGETTTVAGASTTVAGETTTVAGETTTVAGETTSVAGETTTVSGETTTVAGATTTETGETTTVAGATTTIAGETTTVAGATTTVAGETTTVAGATTTVAGATTTVAGETTTVVGATTTIAGETTTVAGASTTVAGETTTVAGASTTVAGETTTLGIARLADSSVVVKTNCLKFLRDLMRRNNILDD